MMAKNDNGGVSSAQYIGVVPGEVQKSRFGNVLCDVIVIRLFNFLTLNY